MRRGGFQRLEYNLRKKPGFEDYELGAEHCVATADTHHCKTWYPRGTCYLKSVQDLDELCYDTQVHD
jgi:hypothetical protein